ncbi:hypothetical protein [Bradyrhizobium diazoefficiens]|uniref:SnoaL-like domain-containing protein n=2 Tax=Bradyrhizobium diazoefficiens TaxID=1355477 RepID=A0A0E3VTF2_9BRAD|nr:hypothetical protein [Bradyrhizobium diazoefficiens]BAR55555.1 hypothetical protein NK6_2374 [Bradyrhizobium diazoefficiens]
MAAALFLATTYWSVGGAQAAANDAEARAIFEKFIAAQNAHDADAVKAMLLNSPGTLLFASGEEPPQAYQVVHALLEPTR